MSKRLLVLALTVGSVLAFAGPKLAPDLPKSGPPIEVIIRFNNPLTTNNLNTVAQYGNLKKQLGVVNAIHISLPPAVLPILENNPAIAYISPNRTTTGALDITTQSVNANLAWNFGFTGTGVGVAVIDSGVALDHDLTASNGVTSRVVYRQNFVSGQDNSDGYGHGTHVAGIIGANGLDSTGPSFSRTFKGVAPNVNIISLKVLDQYGNGQEADVIAAIQTAISLKNVYNIRVINLSLGRPVFESYTLDPLCQAVEAAWNAGIVVVTAAGNYGRDNSRMTHGYGTIASPGNDPYVITVGATNTKGTPSAYDDQIASYSAKGPTVVDHIVKPDIVAPGNGVVSVLASTSCTLYTMTTKTHVNNSYDMTGYPTGVSTSYLKLSGTSMATPVVAGAAALLIQKDPTLTPDQVKERLMRSARKILPSHMYATDAHTFSTFSMVADIFTVGAGYLDINAALANTDRILVSALSPTAIYDPVSHKVSLSSNFARILGQDDSVVWGDSLFFGKLASGSLIVWGADDSVVWGDSLNMGFSVVWGATVNGTSTLAATGADDDDQ